MVNVSGTPVQLLTKGVTIMVAITEALPLLIAVKAGILPKPVAANPIEELLFVHL